MAEQISPEPIMQLGMAFWGSKTLLSAIELDVFGALAKGPRKGATLAGELGLHERSARDFLDALVALGMLDRDVDEYRNTPATDLFLDRAKPSYVGGLLDRHGQTVAGGLEGSRGRWRFHRSETN